MNVFRRTLHRPFFIRLLHWEYWSFNTVYFPILIVWAWLSARARSFFFFSASNPGILYGGFLMESKKAIYDILPAGCYPKTLFFRAGTDAASVIDQVKQLGFIYPLIGKPDIGEKGKDVQKLMNEEELTLYVSTSVLDFLIQECSPYKQEVGIFYYRYPNQEKGSISGIVRKEFLSVRGDGISTIRQLCEKEKRFILQLPVLEKDLGNQMDEVLPEGTDRELVPYGNHIRGAKFLDDSALIDEMLTDCIDAVCRQVKGFYYGRLDVRFNTWEELRQGKHFTIIELNGAGSEPTHMYDPRHSLFFAWKEIIRHWKILWRISRLNHQNGIPYLSHKQGLHMLRENRNLQRKRTNQDV